MTPYALVIVLQIMTAIILLVVGGLRSRIITALVYISAAAAAFAICFIFGKLFDSITNILHWVGIGFSGLILATGFFGVIRPKASKL
jgi:hypothetical protein